MAYVDQYTLGETPAFQQRVQVALADICGTLLVTGSPDSGNREAARGILDAMREVEPVCAIAREVARVVVTHPTVAPTAPTGTDLTDAQLKAAITTILPALVR